MFTVNTAGEAIEYDYLSKDDLIDLGAYDLEYNDPVVTYSATFNGESLRESHFDDNGRLLV